MLTDNIGMNVLNDSVDDTVQKKVAFFLPTLNIGGIERVFITYANYLIDKKYNIYFILCKRRGELLSLLDSNIKLYHLGNVQLKFSFLKLRQSLKEIQPDVIVSGGDFPNLILIVSSLGLKKVPKIIISQHNYYNVETRRLGWWAYGTCFFMKKIYPKADKIIAVSDGIREFLIKKIHISADRIIKLPNPIDIKGIKEKSLELLDITLPDRYILFVGRLSYVKNLFFLLDAFEMGKLDNNSLVIVGDGEMRNALMKKAKKMHKADNIIFLGAMENPLPILKKAQLLVLPSFSEAYPTILLEALCLYIPVVSTPTKGAKEILHNVSGTYISTDCYNIEEFARLMERGVKERISHKVIDDKIGLNSIENIGLRIQREIIEDNRL